MSLPPPLATVPPSVWPNIYYWQEKLQDPARLPDEFCIVSTWIRNYSKRMRKNQRSVLVWRPKYFHGMSSIQPSIHLKRHRDTPNMTFYCQNPTITGLFKRRCHCTAGIWRQCVVIWRHQSIVWRQSCWSSDSKSTEAFSQLQKNFKNLFPTLRE